MVNKTKIKKVILGQVANKRTRSNQKQQEETLNPPFGIRQLFYFYLYIKLFGKILEMDRRKTLPLK